jgi:hypothetical protein
MGFPLSVPCSGHPVELDKPHTLASAAETVFFCNLKSKVSFNLKIKYKQFNETFQLIPVLTPVDSRWTIPLSAFRHENEPTKGIKPLLYEIDDGVIGKM